MAILIELLRNKDYWYLCHLRSGDFCWYVWIQTNTKSEISIKNEKERQTDFGALNYQTK
jgi:hypothetical protein